MSAIRKVATAPWALGAVAFLTAALATACTPPIGLYGTRPETLWALPSTPPGPPPARSAYAGPPIVLKRFDNASLAPVGGLFRGSSPSAESMLQSYSPALDLAPALFEGTYASLRASGMPVWKDYLPSPEIVAGPPGATTFSVLHGVVEELEIDTFEADTQDQAARTKIAFTAYDPTGAKRASFAVETAVRIPLGSADVLVVLGRRVADELAKRIGGGL